jgi:hypothetical protein
MRTDRHETVRLGELVIAAFDSAATYSADPKEVSHLATLTVMAMLQRAVRGQIIPNEVRKLRSKHRLSELATSRSST